jgi:hypothetical protein
MYYPLEEVMLFYATVFYVDGIWSSLKSTVSMSEQWFLVVPGIQWGVCMKLQCTLNLKSHNFFPVKFVIFIGVPFLTIQ